jgi:hypothetical protein
VTVLSYDGPAARVYVEIRAQLGSLTLRRVKPPRFPAASPTPSDARLAMGTRRRYSPADQNTSIFAACPGADPSRASQVTSGAAKASASARYAAS